MSQASLSVIALATAQSHALRDGLASVHGWADEVIMLDTRPAASAPLFPEFGARVITAEPAELTAHTNRAFAQARGDWLLYLDENESIGSALKAEIEQILRGGSQHAGFSVPRRSTFCGQIMRHSGCWPDRVERLFRRETTSFKLVGAYSRAAIAGSVGQLREPISRIAARDVTESFALVDRDSSAAAQVLFKQGRNASLGQALACGVSAFVQTYLSRLGCLDGRPGFMLAVAHSERAYYQALKLMLLQRRARAEQAGHDQA